MTDSVDPVIDFTEPVGDRDAAIVHSSMFGFWIGFWLAGIGTWAIDLAEPGSMTTRVAAGLLVAVLAGRWGAQHAHLWHYDGEATHRWRRRDAVLVGLAGLALCGAYAFMELR